MNLLLLASGEHEIPTHDQRARHIRKVLRLSVGDTLRAGIVDGPVGVATIRESGPGGIRVDFEPTADPRPLPHVELLLGHPRPIVLRRLLRDLTAIGAGRIVVTVTELGEKSYYESNLWDDPRTPMLEGAAQGGTTLLPELLRAGSLTEAIETLASASPRRLMLHPESEPGERFAPPATPELIETLQRLAGTPYEEEGPGAPWLTVAIGSERGWTDREVAVLAGAGFSACSLGRRILRTETAAAVSLWAAVSSYDSSRCTASGS